MGFPRIVLGVTGVVFVTLGLVFFSSPPFLASLLGIEFGTVDAMNDIRAIYGGLEIGVGFFILYCARQPQLVPLGLVASTLAFGCMVLARFGSFFLDGAPTSPLMTAWAIEGIGLVLCVLALRRVQAA